MVIHQHGHEFPFTMWMKVPPRAITVYWFQSSVFTKSPSAAGRQGAHEPFPRRAKLSTSCPRHAMTAHRRVFGIELARINLAGQKSACGPVIIQSRLTGPDWRVTIGEIGISHGIPVLLRY